MKQEIVDFELHGNVIKLFLGDSSKDYGGNGWHKRPYEHNSEEISEKYVNTTKDIAIKSDYLVLSPENDYTYQGNSPYSKNDFKDGVAFVVISSKDTLYDYYNYQVGNKSNPKLYFGMDIKEVLELLDEYLIK